MKLNKLIIPLTLLLGLQTNDVSENNKDNSNKRSTEEANKMLLTKSEYHFYDKTYEKKRIESTNNKFVMLKYKTKPTHDKCIIWIPGFKDYMFHFHIIEKLFNEGYDIYGMVLRNFSEVIEEEQKEFIGYIDNIQDYVDDINILMDNIIKEKKYKNMNLYGHSTGGLVGLYYSHMGKYKNKIDKLVLNSPFLDFNESTFNEYLIKKNVVSLFSYFLPKFTLKDYRSENYYVDIKSRFYYEDSLYGVSNSKNEVYIGWIKVVSYYQKFVRNNKLDKPILVLYSSNSIPKNTNDIKLISSGDAILDINDIDKYSDYLGDKVEKYVINNATHDVFLSKKDKVDEAYSKMISWLKKNI